jgi:hypothetical protein
MAVRVAHAVAHRPIYASVLPRNNRTTPPHLVTTSTATASQTFTLTYTPNF